MRGVTSKRQGRERGMGCQYVSVERRWEMRSVTCKRRQREIGYLTVRHVNF